MTAEPDPRPPSAQRQLRIFRPEDEVGGRARDFQSRARVPDADPGETGDLAEHFRRVQSAHRDEVEVLPEAERARVRQGLTLPQFYERHYRPLREARLEKGQGKKSTFDKERWAMRRFADWDRRQAPEDWPDDVAWTGLPIGYLTGSYLDRFLAEMVGRMARDTVKATWYHLRTILNHAVKIKALEAAPKPGPLPEPSGDEDLFADVFTDEELTRIYDALAGQPALQTALVLGANVGPRPVDLFLLRWERNVRIDVEAPEVIYRARKTGKTHRVPLAPCTVVHLQRLRKGTLVESDSYLFRDLCSPGAKQPERTRVARRRTGRFKAALQQAGVEVYERPNQVLRATCNTRLNNHRPGVGRLVLHGPDASDVNSKYDDPWPRIKEAVMAVPQPEAFTRILF